MAGAAALILAISAAAAACGLRALEQQPSPVIMVADGQRAIPLDLSLGPDGATLAFVPIYINQQGPFSFAIDTGASHTLIDSRVARQLGLRVTGSAGQVTGIVASAMAEEVRVDSWTLGDVSLPASDLISLELPQGNGEMRWQGLLGSDMLSAFGAVTIDYERKLLLLGRN